LHTVARRSGAVHVVTTRRTYKDKVYETHLLRRSYREGDTVKNETLGNLSHLPSHLIDLIRRVLQGEAVAPVAQVFEITSSRAHGHVEAVRATMARVGLDSLLASRGGRERDLVCAMVAARIIAPHTKLATTRWWHTTTLAEEFDVTDADEDDLYAAMDWLLERQGAIEKKLAARHLGEGSLVLYDLSSSYFEGMTCPLAKLGHNRDGKKGKLQVNYGLLTDRRGCPVAVSVYDGKTNDPKTFMPQVHKLKKDFGIQTLVLVGDRGMISQKAIDELREQEQVPWITALKTGQIRARVEGGQLQLGLFDERVGKVVNKYKVAKHFALDIEDHRFGFHRLQDNIASEAALDGIYVIRTSLAKKQMTAADCVRNYKSLAEVERAFRSMKTIDLKIRPIHHHLADRVRSHIFLCMLAYYVEWHMREAWRPLLFADEDQLAKTTRDPVAAAKRSAAAEAKAASHLLDDGTPAHSFSTLQQELATIVRNTCRAPQAADGAPTFKITTTPNPKQRRALELLNAIRL
jgi:hypothetical protein